MMNYSAYISLTIPGLHRLHTDRNKACLFEKMSYNMYLVTAHTTIRQNFRYKNKARCFCQNILPELYVAGILSYVDSYILQYLQCILLNLT